MQTVRPNHFDRTPPKRIDCPPRKQKRRMPKHAPPGFDGARVGATDDCRELPYRLDTQVWPAGQALARPPVESFGNVAESNMFSTLGHGVCGSLRSGTQKM
jgi:hypothetical protein